ncbi:MAG: hypothetical protein ACUVXA_18310, partial [Candidatus Jordarchaeum sp.]|uniref:hypothetical protein n=1 Tax=Candidatus Jordarchaeum sp. TaxID=2823881 RepID=UPI00404918CE
MKNTVLDKWCSQQNKEVKHYCQVCGICIHEEEIQNSEAEQHFCTKHKELSLPNTLLMDDQLFKAVFKTIQKILKRDNTNELTFEVGREGARFRYMDPSHVSLTEIQLYTKAFKTLNIDFHTPKTLTINADELEKILPKVEEQDEVLIRFDEHNIQLSLLGKSYAY